MKVPPNTCEYSSRTDPKKISRRNIQDFTTKVLKSPGFICQWFRHFSPYKLFGGPITRPPVLAACWHHVRIWHIRSSRCRPRLLGACFCIPPHPPCWRPPLSQRRIIKGKRGSVYEWYPEWKVGRICRSEHSRSPRRSSSARSRIRTRIDFEAGSSDQIGESATFFIRRPDENLNVSALSFKVGSLISEQI